MHQHVFDALICKLETIVSLADEEKSALLELPVVVRELRADQEIVRDGDRPSQCCLLVDGMLCRYKGLLDGGRQIVGFYLPGDIPDLHSLHVEEMDHDLATITPSRVAFIAHEAMRKLTTAHPRIADAFWRDTLSSEPRKFPN